MIKKFQSHYVYPIPGSNSMKSRLILLRQLKNQRQALEIRNMKNRKLLKYLEKG